MDDIRLDEHRDPRKPVFGRTRGARLAALRAIVVVSTTGAHLTFLGWHHLQEYQTWKVVSYAVILGIVVVVAAWLRAGRDAVRAVTVAATVLWCLDAATSRGDGANMWMAGAVFVAGGVWLGSALVVAIVGAAREAYDRHVAWRSTR